MSDPIQAEPTAPAGSGDADFDAAIAQASADAAPVVDPPAEPAPVDPAPVVAEPSAVDPDFTLVTLPNGQREMTLPTGQVYRGKDDAELYGQLAKAQIAASRRITELSKPVEPPPTPSAAATAPPEAVDPTALAILDLIAPALKLKNGAEVVAKFSGQDQTTAQFQEYMASQAANYEAQKFFMAVPEFSKSQADADKIDTFLQTNSIPFNANTAEMAYHTLKAKGEMTAAPVTTRPAAPVNTMPPPPAGAAPANTGKGTPTEADLWSMTPDQLEALMTAGATQ